MKKILLFIFILLCGCSQKNIEIIHKMDGYTIKEIGEIEAYKFDDLYQPFLCEENVVCVKGIEGKYYKVDLIGSKIIDDRSRIIGKNLTGALAGLIEGNKELVNCMLLAFTNKDEYIINTCPGDNNIDNIAKIIGTNIYSYKLKKFNNYADGPFITK